MAQHFVCTSCGYYGKPQRTVKGSGGVEILLWLCFIIPGLIYSVWRSASRYNICPKCKKETLIPADTPIGRETLHRLGVQVSEIQHIEHTASWRSPDLRMVLKFAAAVFFIIISLQIWFITIPLALIAYLYKVNTTLEPRMKKILSAVTIIAFAVVGGLFINATAAPDITISEPQENASFSTKTATIRGEISQSATEVTINGKPLTLNPDGTFTYEAALINEKNTFTIEAKNGAEVSIESIVLRREFTLEEKAERDRLRAEAEAKQQAEIAAQKEKEEAELAAYYASKPGKICKAHPTWTKDECQWLADNKIWVGMDYEMVVYLRGKPESVNPSNYGNGTQYQYCWHDYNPSCFYDRNDDGLIDAYN